MFFYLIFMWINVFFFSFLNESYMIFLVKRMIEFIIGPFSKSPKIFLESDRLYSKNPSSISHLFTSDHHSWITVHVHCKIIWSILSVEVLQDEHKSLGLIPILWSFSKFWSVPPVKIFIDFDANPCIFKKNCLHLISCSEFCNCI